MDKTAFIYGEKVYLRKLRREDLNECYLQWLNDPEILKYSGRKSYPTGMEQLEQYYERLQSSTDLSLAICMKDSDKHVGNLSLNSILWLHRSAELSIVVGDKSVWGKGVARDAMQAICKHAFTAMNLYRVWAESPNPAFNRAVQKLGWIKEGCKRESFFHEGKYIDLECYAILQPEWLKLFGEDSTKSKQLQKKSRSPSDVLQ